MTRSLILGPVILVAFLLLCAYVAMRIKWPLELLAVLGLSVPACAACALVFRGRQR